MINRVRDLCQVLETNQKPGPSGGSSFKKHNLYHKFQPKISTKIFDFLLSNFRNFDYNPNLKIRTYFCACDFRILLIFPHILCYVLGVLNEQAIACIFETGLNFHLSFFYRPQGVRPVASGNEATTTCIIKKSTRIFDD